MSDSHSNRKQAGVYINASDIDVTDAALDPGLSKVWTDEATGEIVVSVERVLFDSLLDISARYLEPHGYSLNLENLLATIDSMRMGVFANTTSKPGSDGRSIAKKLIPGLYMHLPRSKTVGPLLTRFYDEIGRYERELARLQDVEAKTRKLADAAVKDDSGRQTIEALRGENQGLRDELTRLSKRLSMAEDAMRAVPVSSPEGHMPTGVRASVVRAVRVSEGVALLKSGDQQFTTQLRKVGGIPAVSARALTYHESGVLKSVLVFDPAPTPFESRLAEVMATDGRKIKLRYSDRREGLLTLAADQDVPPIGAKMMAKLAHGFLVDIVSIGVADDRVISDLIYDEQTKRQIDEQFAGGRDD